MLTREPTEIYALLVRDALNKLHFKYEQPVFPYKLHHSTKEMRRWKYNSPLTIRDCAAFDIGIRTAIEISINVLQEGKYLTMEPADVYGLVYRIDHG